LPPDSSSNFATPNQGDPLEADWPFGHQPFWEELRDSSTNRPEGQKRCAARIAQPSAFLSHDPKLSAVLAPLWRDPGFAADTPAKVQPVQVADRSGLGSSFWMRTT